MPMRRFRTWICALAALAASTGSPAYAEGPGIDARTWRPTADPRAGLVLEPATVPEAGTLFFLADASYAYRPVTVRDLGTRDVLARPVEHALLADLGVGFTPLPGLAAAVLAPMALAQSGQDGLPGAAFGDVNLHLKYTALANPEGRLGVAWLGDVTLPTGARSSFLAESTATVATRLLAEYSVVVASLEASVGYATRPSVRDFGGTAYGNAIPWTFGVTVLPGLFKLDPSGRQRWELAVRGALPLGDVGPFGVGKPGSAEQTPFLLTVADRVELGHYHDFAATLGADIGLVAAFGVPVIRGILGLSYMPRSHDKDKDGVPDDVDMCPEIPEDKDGFEDNDGCPEIDNDDDGVLDVDDACPNVAGVESPDPRRNGCPAPAAPRGGGP
jgi:hypothetical protein